MPILPPTAKHSVYHAWEKVVDAYDDVADTTKDVWDQLSKKKPGLLSPIDHEPWGADDFFKPAPNTKKGFGCTYKPKIRWKEYNTGIWREGYFNIQYPIYTPILGFRLSGWRGGSWWDTGDNSIGDGDKTVYRKVHMQVFAYTSMQFGIGRYAFYLPSKLTVFPWCNYCEIIGWEKVTCPNEPDDLMDDNDKPSDFLPGPIAPPKPKLPPTKNPPILPPISPVPPIVPVPPIAPVPIAPFPLPSPTINPNPKPPPNPNPNPSPTPNPNPTPTPTPTPIINPPPPPPFPNPTPTPTPTPTPKPPPGLVPHVPPTPNGPAPKRPTPNPPIINPPTTYPMPTTPKLTKLTPPVQIKTPPVPSKAPSTSMPCLPSSQQQTEECDPCAKKSQETVEELEEKIDDFLEELEEKLEEGCDQENLFKLIGENRYIQVMTLCLAMQNQRQLYSTLSNITLDKLANFIADGSFDYTDHDGNTKPLTTLAMISPTALCDLAVGTNNRDLPNDHYRDNNIAIVAIANIYSVMVKWVSQIFYVIRSTYNTLAKLSNSLRRIFKLSNQEVSPVPEMLVTNAPFMNYTNDLGDPPQIIGLNQDIKETLFNMILTDDVLETSTQLHLESIYYSSEADKTGLDTKDVIDKANSMSPSIDLEDLNKPD